MDGCVLSCGLFLMGFGVHAQSSYLQFLCFRGKREKEDGQNDEASR